MKQSYYEIRKYNRNLRYSQEYLILNSRYNFMRIIKSSILLNNRKKGSAFFYDTSEKLSGNLEHFSNRATVTGPFHRIRIARRDDLQLLRIRYS